MAKRPNKARAGSTKAPGAKKAGKTGPAEEPFFRPFSKLKNLKKAEAPAQGKAAGAATAKGGAKDEKRSDAKDEKRSDAKSGAREASPPPKRDPKTQALSTAAQLVDAETFALYMSGVRALDSHHANRIPRTASGVERASADLLPKADLDAPARAEMRSLVAEGLRFESTDDGERLEGRRVDVDPRELRRLRRGQYAIDGKLDLHGMSLTEAREAVGAFVRKRASDGDRVVAIIHGKGTHSPRGIAVLRGEIGAWLSDGRAARHVMAFATAPEDHGGTGALLVLLAR